MSDEADKAQQHIERQVELAPRKPVGPTANGSCHNCGEHLKPGLRFCDFDCAEDWQKREDLNLYVRG